MAWAILLSSDAAKQLAGLPRDRQELVAGAIDQMSRDPFQGDVKPLRGPKWAGRYRKRVGRYRIIFQLHRSEQKVEISQILLRSEQTYR